MIKEASMLKPGLKVFLSLVLFFLSGYQSASIAATPDAGSIMNQQQQVQPSLPERIETQEGIQTDDKKTAAPDTNDRKVLVKGFRFTGIEGVANSSELSKVIKDSVGKEFSFSELQNIADRITGYLKSEKGYLLSKAYLPQQDITEGIIEIAVLTGKLEVNPTINISGESRINPKVLEGIAAKSASPNEALRLDKIERAVLLMNDLPGISAKASIEQGASPGTSKLVINAAEGKLLKTTLSLDSYGDRYTGIFRSGLQANFNDPFKAGDQIALSVNKAKKMTQARTDYSIPVGSQGMTGSAYYSYLKYSLGKELTVLEAKGTAQNAGIGLTYPVVRTRNSGVWSNLGIDYMNLKDKIFGETTGDRKLFIGKAGLTANHYDGFGGGGMTMSSLNIDLGNVDLSGLKIAGIYDKSGPKTSGRFIRATYSLARLQRITQQTSLFLSARGQFSAENLDSSEKFILGGPTGVRAYPVSEGSGDSGHMMTLEVRHDLPLQQPWFNTQLVSFIDTGIVRLHKTPWSGSINNATDNNRYSLSGAGLGINISKTGLYSVRMSYAHSIGVNAGRNKNNTNVDNKNSKGRFWLQGAISF
jgi:hemolysin activation/secretion protein